MIFLSMVLRHCPAIPGDVYKRQVLAFVDNGVFSAFDLKKERFLSVVSSSGQGIPSRGMLQRNDSLVCVISGSELHLMKRCASKEGELSLIHI